MKYLFIACAFMFTLVGGYAVWSDLINLVEGKELEHSVLGYLSAGWFFIYGLLMESIGETKDNQ